MNVRVCEVSDIECSHGCGVGTCKKASVAPAEGREFGHGHVTPRPDGHKARCGGPAICHVCQAEQARLPATRLPPPPMPAVKPAKQSPAEGREFSDEWAADVLGIPHTIIGTTEFSNHQRQRIACVLMGARAALTTAPTMSEAVRDKVIGCAKRLIDGVEWNLGGILSAESKTKDIPSKAVSSVKSRHLASLRDALREMDRANTEGEKS